MFSTFVTLAKHQSGRMNFKCRHNKPSPDRYVPLFSMRKPFIISIIIGLTLSSKGQVPKEISLSVPKLPLSINDTSSTRVELHPERTTRIPRSENPLVIIDEKQFNYCDFSNLHFDVSSVLKKMSFHLQMTVANCMAKLDEMGLLS
jgi:hypothetical protein